MASVWRHPKSKFWSACYRLPDGTRTKRTTKETNRKKALALAELLEAEFRRAVPASRARQLIADAYKNSTAKELPQKTIKSFFADWLSAKKPELDVSTSEKYTATVRDFIEYLGEKAAQDLLLISLEDLHGFRDHVAQHQAPKTANNKLTVISSALRLAYRDSMLAEDISGRVRKLKIQGQQQTRNPFSEDQMRRIYSVATGEWKGLVLFGYYTGQRLGDIASLHWHQIDLAQKIVSLRSEKQNRVTTVPLVPPLVRWIRQHPQSHPASPLFPETFATLKKNRGKVSALSKQFGVLLADAGLAKRREQKPQGKGRSARRTLSPLSFHSFRHTLTSDLKARGGGAAITQDIVGHDSTAVSDRYTHVDDDVKRRFLEKLPDITAD